MKRLISTSLIIALGILASTQASARVTGDPIRTDAGLVEGVWSANANVRSYLGIPFAQPPVGNLRWREPQPVAPWSGVRKADKLPPMCIQGARAPGSISYEAYGNIDMPMSEDCLYLNVWTPADIQPGQKLPVLFWIHGGGNATGSGSKIEFNGDVLAQKGMIVVTTNYRINVFGWMAHPELTAESPHKASGNYGRLDLVASLQWVQKNIAAFGGDPSQVTISGQSAGAGAVNHLMASPMAKGLFTRASPQSGGGVGGGAATTLKEGEAAGVRFASMIGNQSIAQLRAMPATTLLSIYGDTGVRMGPLVDGYFMPKDPSAIWAAGEQAAVPYMPGWSGSEGMEQTYDRTLAEYERLATQRVGANNLQALKQLYGVKDDETATTLGRVGLSRDAGTGRGMWRTVRMQAPRAPTYLYYWNRHTPIWAGQSFAENSPASLLGAYHGSQVPYLFGNLQLLDREFTAVDRRLSDEWHRYLINFTKTGNPNGPGLPEWPRYGPNSESALHMQERTAAGPVPNRDKMEFFERVVPAAAPAPSSGRASMISGR